MNNMKVKVYVKVFKEICEKCEGVEEFINKKLDEVCSYEKLSAETVIYFLVSFLAVK